jgi:DNA-binding transcriptional LysR family regulator
MDPDLAWLRAFVAVSEELHFGRAALRLGISQPQISRHVRALEENLGVELFIRTARRTEPTEAGATLLADAREVLAASERLCRRADGRRRRLGGSVSVGFIWSTLSSYLAPLVSAAAERLPDVELAVSQLAYLELVPSLRRGDIDVAIARPLYEQSEMAELLLRQEQSVLAVHTGHPLTARATIELESLNGLPLISLRRELVRAAYDALLERARARGVDIQIVREVRSAAEALALVSVGIGVYRMPASAAAPFPGVEYLPITDSYSKLVLLHRPLVGTPVDRVVALAVELFGDAGSASKNVGFGLALSPAAT